MFVLFGAGSERRGEEREMNTYIGRYNNKREKGRKTVGRLLGST
jgi:hypothetical protein